MPRRRHRRVGGDEPGRLRCGRDTRSRGRAPRGRARRRRPLSAKHQLLDRQEDPMSRRTPRLFAATARGRRARPRRLRRATPTDDHAAGAGTAGRRLPGHRRHAHPGQAPREDRLAVADRDRDALRHRRRHAGHRRRRPVELPGRRAEDRPVRLPARTPRRSPAKNPDLVVLSDDTNKIVDQLDHAEDPGATWPPAATTLDDTYRQITELGTLTGHADRGGRRRRSG